MDVVQKSGLVTLSARQHFRYVLKDTTAEKITPFIEQNFGAGYIDSNDKATLDRTIIFDTLITKEINGGKIKSIFNIGCGFCTRYWRLGLDKTDIVWVDCDFDNTISTKKKALELAGINLPSTYQVDSRDISIKGIPKGFDLYIAEGSLMWIDLEIVQNNIHNKIICDVIGRTNNRSKIKEQKWQFDEELSWQNFNIHSKTSFDNPGRAGTILVMSPKETGENTNAN